MEESEKQAKIRKRKNFWKIFCAKKTQKIGIRKRRHREYCKAQIKDPPADFKNIDKGVS